MVHGAWFMVHGSWFMVHGSGFMVQGSWFRVHGSGFRVHGSLFMVLGLLFSSIELGAFGISLGLRDSVLRNSRDSGKKNEPVSFLHLGGPSPNQLGIDIDLGNVVYDHPNLVKRLMSLGLRTRRLGARLLDLGPCQGLGFQTLRPCLFSRMCLSVVVLPEPRNPERNVSGTCEPRQEFQHQRKYQHYQRQSHTSDEGEEVNFTAP